MNGEQTMTIEPVLVTDADLREKKRGLRRHHIERLKKCRQYQWGRKLGGKELGKAVHTPCLCSCFLCSNKRKWNGKTIQERKQMGVDDF